MKTYYNLKAFLECGASVAKGNSEFICVYFANQGHWIERDFRLMAAALMYAIMEDLNERADSNSS